MCTVHSAIVKLNKTIKTKKLSIIWSYLALICRAEIPYPPPFYLNCKFLFTISLVSLEYASIRKFVNKIWSRILFSSLIIDLVSLWNCVRNTSLYSSHEPDCSTSVAGACNCVKELVKKLFNFYQVLMCLIVKLRVYQANWK